MKGFPRSTEEKHVAERARDAPARGTLKFALAPTPEKPPEDACDSEPVRVELRPVVMVVEDEPLLLRQYVRLLEGSRVGFRVLALDNVADALEVDATLDGALVDLYVGREHPLPLGLPLLETLRHRVPELPLILLSAALPDAEESNHLVRLGALRLTKPFELAHLATWIERVRAHRTARIGRLGFHRYAYRLSDRERRCIEGALARVPHPSLADELAVRPSTVKTYIARAHAKLGSEGLDDLREQLDEAFEAVRRVEPASFD